MMSGRGHRKLRLSSLKNYERKKYKAAPLTLSVSIQLSVVSVSVAEDPLPSLTVSLPVSAFRDAPLATVQTLRTRLQKLQALPLGGCASHIYSVNVHVCV